MYPLISDVATEKTQKALLDGVEAFDPSKLKHTETQEKNPLPDKDGEPSHSARKHSNIVD